MLSRALIGKLSRDVCNLTPTAWPAGQLSWRSAAAGLDWSPAQNGVLPDPGLLVRCAFSTSPSSSQQQRLVTAFLQDVLSSLSIPHAELQQLAASGLSDAALTAWALTKTASHPAAHEAAAASQKMQHLLAKLDGALLWQQQANASPLAQLLWQVAVGVSSRRLSGVQMEDLGAQLEYQVAQARKRASGGPPGPHDTQQVLEEALKHMHHLADTVPLAALGHPAFWQLAQQAAASSEALTSDLPLLGYDLAAAAGAAAGQLQQLQQLVGLNAAELQQQLSKVTGVSSNLLLPGKTKELLVAVANDAGAKQAVAQLQLLQVLGQLLGLSAVQVCGPVSACELVRRLTGVALPEQDAGQQLQQELAAAAPQLTAAVSQLPAATLAQATPAALLQLMSSKPELQALAKSLTAWRGQAAAAGYVPVLTTLSQAEVAALSKPQAEALGRAIMQLEARGRLLLRKAAAKQLQLGELDADDASALAWKVHAGGAAAAEDLVKLLLAQAAHSYAVCVAELDSAHSALGHMAVGFNLEEVTSRRSTAAPPSPLVLAGVPQHQVAELSKSLPSLTGSSSSSSSSSSKPTSGSGHAEALVRDLALLLEQPSGRPASPAASVLLGGQQAAAQRLQIVAHDLPKVLSGPLLDLVTAMQPGSVKDAATAQQQQQLLRSFLHVLESELPRLAAAAASPGETSVAGSSVWNAASGALVSGREAQGLYELLGEQDSGEVLAYAAEVAPPARGDFEDEGGEEGGLYDTLADIHADIDVQRYLQMEFDPALELDVVHAPRGWQDPDLFVSAAEFLDGMRPLLDKYLAAQGEAPVEDLEWQVYSSAALAEHEQVEVAASANHRAAGHSPFHNSRADQAYLTQRLDAGIPKSSVLYAAAHKYLAASFKNRSWRFAQRKHMVDRLVEIAAHLAAHPARTHRGSPFSALFQPDGPPAVPRMARKEGGPAGGSRGDVETYALPAGFGDARQQ